LASYRRTAGRRGKNRAIVAIGRCILVIVWAVLSDEETRFVDLGAERVPPQSPTQSSPARPRAADLGYAVTLNPQRELELRLIFRLGTLLRARSHIVLHAIGYQ
jgi:hypothetical protein